MKKVWFALILVFFLAVHSEAKQLTLGWNYNRFFFDSMVDGFKIYMGTVEGNYPTLIANIPKSQIIIHSEKPILLKETFDSDPGTKYPLEKGSWKWVSETKNMKIENDFMIVFTRSAGESNDMSFNFWPEKKLGDAPIIYSYIKDESIAAYYELRLAGSDGTRYSNWRKVYDQKYEGIDPNGAFALPRYPQCSLLANQNTVCPGFMVSMSWQPEDYSVSITPIGGLSNMKAAASLKDIDKKPLVINKAEILVNQQTGWIDNIIIGGQMNLRYTINYTDTNQKVYFAATAYNQIGESDKSISVAYEVIEDNTQKTPGAPLKFRKL